MSTWTWNYIGFGPKCSFLLGASGSFFSFTRVFPAAAAAAKSLQSCPTLCDPIDGSPPGSPIPGTLKARILEWVAISFSNAWKWKVKVKSLSRVWLLATPCDSVVKKKKKYNCQCRRLRRHGFNLWVGRSPGERHGSPLQYPVFLSRESHGQRSLASYNPWGCKESNMTEPSSPRKTKQSIGSESFSATLDKVILPLKGWFPWCQSES